MLKTFFRWRRAQPGYSEDYREDTPLQKETEVSPPVGSALA